MQRDLERFSPETPLTAAVHLYAVTVLRRKPDDKQVRQLLRELARWELRTIADLYAEVLTDASLKRRRSSPAVTRLLINLARWLKRSTPEVLPTLTTLPRERPGKVWSPPLVDRLIALIRALDLAAVNARAPRDYGELRLQARAADERRRLLPVLVVVRQTGLHPLTVARVRVGDWDRHARILTVRGGRQKGEYALGLNAATLVTLSAGGRAASGWLFPSMTTRAWSENSLDGAADHIVATAPRKLAPDADAVARLYGPTLVLRRARRMQRTRLLRRTVADLIGLARRTGLSVPELIQYAQLQGAADIVDASVDTPLDRRTTHQVDALIAIVDAVEATFGYASRRWLVTPHPDVANLAPIAAAVHPRHAEAFRDLLRRTQERSRAMGGRRGP